MEALAHLLPRPAFNLTPAMEAAFEDLAAKTSPGALVEYAVPYPKWQFLSYLCETRELVLHGSQHRAIDVVEPRQANDQRAFSNQRAIYATTDGIWVIYFAILDRQRHPEMTLFNSCLRLRTASERWSDPLYFFSITHSARLQAPWCEGMIYILPRRAFLLELPHHVPGAEIQFPHWVSESPAAPVMKLSVGPQDFPFLDQIHGHDNERLVQATTANPNGFPWPEAWLS